MKKIIMRRLISVLCASGVLGISTQIFASGFQLWEQDDGGIGNFHAGYAALAKDASTAFYNPAGITRIKNQQLVLGTAGIVSDIKFKGTVAVNTLNGNTPQAVTAQGGGTSLVPDLHYVAPITDSIGFGLSIDAPFGAKIDYGKSTILRYTAYRAIAKIIDIAPALGFQLTDQFSLGLGVDIQKMSAEFDEVGRSSDNSDTDSVSKASDTAYGVHVGGLYQFSQNTRVGLSYHSKIEHHLRGTSKFIGPMNNQFSNGQPIISNNTKSNITLPPYTALSIFHRVNPKWSLMGSVIYTQWSVMKELRLQNIAGIQNLSPSTTIAIILPNYYRNTWNISVGADYDVTDYFTLRTGVGFDQAPTKNAYRNIELPDNDRYAVAFGGHYQATKNVGVDLGWTHLFVKNASINNITQATGDQQVTTDGRVKGCADVYGAELIWDIV